MKWYNVMKPGYKNINPEDSRRFKLPDFITVGTYR
jgi:hypothetical protein